MAPVDEISMVVRLIFAAGLGMLVGLERERHSKAAGLRSCMLVCMAGALVMCLSLYLAQMFSDEAADSVVRLDPARLPSYAIAGMGFLGAGAIIQGRRSAWGVTTGAALWLLTGVGLAVGAGLYIPAMAAVAVALLALAVFPYLAALVSHEQQVLLTLDALSMEAIDEVRRLLGQYRAEIIFAGKEHCLATDLIKYNFRLKIIAGKRWNKLTDEIEKTPGINCYSWQEAEVP